MSENFFKKARPTKYKNSRRSSESSDIIDNRPPPIPLQNKYDILNNLADDDDNTDIEVNAENPTPCIPNASSDNNKNNVQPFWMELSPNHRDYLKTSVS